MIWNPSSEMTSPVGEPVFGGSHWIYVFKNDRRIRGASNPGQFMPAYDECRHFYNNLPQPFSTAAAVRLYRAVAWVGSALVVPGRQLLETDVRVVLNVAKPYIPYVDYPGSLSPIEPERNAGLPLYAFSTTGLTENNVPEVAESALDLINVVPNPYYGFSG